MLRHTRHLSLIFAAALFVASPIGEVSAAPPVKVQPRKMTRVQRVKNTLLRPAKALARIPAKIFGKKAVSKQFKKLLKKGRFTKAKTLRKNIARASQVAKERLVEAETAGNKGAAKLYRTLVKELTALADPKNDPVNAKAKRGQTLADAKLSATAARDARMNTVFETLKNLDAVTRAGKKTSSKTAVAAKRSQATAEQAKPGRRISLRKIGGALATGLTAPLRAIRAIRGAPRAKDPNFKPFNRRLRELDAQLIQGNLVEASKIVDNMEADAAYTRGVRGLLNSAKAIVARSRLRKTALREGKEALSDGSAGRTADQRQSIASQAREMLNELRTQRDTDLAGARTKKAKAAVLETYAQQRAELKGQVAEVNKQLQSKYSQGRKVLGKLGQKRVDGPRGLKGMIGRLRARRTRAKLDRALFREIGRQVKQGPDGLLGARLLLMTARGTSGLVSTRKYASAYKSTRKHINKTIKKAIKDGHVDGVDLAYKLKWEFERDANPGYEPSEREIAKMEKAKDTAGKNIAGRLLKMATWIMSNKTAAERQGFSPGHAEAAIRVIEGLARDGKVTSNKVMRKTRSAKRRLNNRRGLLRRLVSVAALPVTMPLKLVHYLTVRQVREALLHHQHGASKPPMSLKEVDVTFNRYDKFFNAQQQAPEEGQAAQPQYATNPMTGE